MAQAEEVVKVAVENRAGEVKAVAWSTRQVQLAIRLVVGVETTHRSEANHDELN